MGNKQEIKEAINQLENLRFHCEDMSKAGESEEWKEDTKALDLAIELLKKELYSEKADIITVRSEYEPCVNYNYSNTDIETIKGLIATNIGKKLLEDNLIDFYKITKGKTTIGDIYTFRGEIKVVKSSNSLERLKLLGKAVTEVFKEGFNEGFNEAEKLKDKVVK